jgi:hypothetical protein
MLLDRLRCSCVDVDVDVMDAYPQTEGREEQKPKNSGLGSGTRT